MRVAVTGAFGQSGRCITWPQGRGPRVRRYNSGTRRRSDRCSQYRSS